MAPLGQRHRGGSFASNVAVLLGGGVLAQLVALAAMPIVSRLYSPGEFGLFGFLSSASILIGTATSFGMTSAIMLSEDGDEAREMLDVTFSMMLIGFVVCVGLGVLGLQLCRPSAGQELDEIHLLLAMLLLALVNNVRGALSTYANRMGFTRLLASNAIVSGLAVLVVTVPLGYAGAGALGLVGGALAGSAIGVVQMMVRAHVRFQWPSWGSFRRVTFCHRRFIFFQWPANVVNSIGEQFPTQVLSMTFSPLALGNYSMVERLIATPLRVIAAPISTIYFRTASEAVLAKRSFSAFTYYLVVRALLASMVPMIVLALWGESLFALLLGEQWRAVGSLSVALVPALALRFCSTAIQYGLVAAQWQRASMWLSLARVFLLSVASWLALTRFHAVEDVVWAFSVAMSIYEAGHILLVFVALRGHVWRVVPWLGAFAIGAIIIWGLVGVFPRFAV